MGVIYKATNISNNKSYIGYAVNFEKRKKSHQWCAEKDKRSQYFYNAIKKYGWENFDWTIIKEDASLEDEIRLIEEHQTYYVHGKGYNLTLGGEGKLGFITSDETRDRISKSLRGKPVSEERLAILRANGQRMKEMGHSEETKQKISTAHKGVKKSEEHKLNISLNHAARKETGSFYHSEEYKEKMSKSLKGKVRTPEQRERYRQAALNRKKKK